MLHNVAKFIEWATGLVLAFAGLALFAMMLKGV